ncbi:hypothetical protein F4821DRAFT_223127 [Hypoxylon rubiginosum]|uniref:Uncharacterized protein n=1 Tax=Hypoxylon rubiginosum TaxID=110542 RepID=A0ACC0DK62_9PEZI|nr:hypothetical protein F4821DRAFT_223127 [Hypoxylon rubiginosum]
MKLDNQVATLRLLRERGRIPVPEVIRFDQSTENELNARYMIQNRVPGIELFKGYPRLDWRAKYKLARELGHVYRELLATYSDAPGALVLPVDHSAKFELVPWHRPRVARTREYNDSPVPQDLYKILVDIFIARKESDLRRWPNKTAGPRLMDRFCVMASELSERGWFEDCRMSLEHFDITPRNIIVHPEPSTGNPVISGIIDWDQAVFAPHFVCCKPPAWLWTWLAGSDHDGFHAHEQLAPGEPPTPEGRKLKRIFDESAGLEYVRFAYTPAYRLARLLVYITIRGLVWQNHIEAKETNWVYKLGNEVISCWATISGDKKRGWRRRGR